MGRLAVRPCARRGLWEREPVGLGNYRQVRVGAMRGAAPMAGGWLADGASTQYSPHGPVTRVVSAPPGPRRVCATTPEPMAAGAFSPHDCGVRAIPCWRCHALSRSSTRATASGPSAVCGCASEARGRGACAAAVTGEISGLAGSGLATNRGVLSPCCWRTVVGLTAPLATAGEERAACVSPGAAAMRVGAASVGDGDSGATVTHSMAGACAGALRISGPGACDSTENPAACNRSEPPTAQTRRLRATARPCSVSWEITRQAT